MPSGQHPPLTTQPLDRSASESRLTDLACDRRAARLLDANPELARHVDDVAKALAGVVGRLPPKAFRCVIRGSLALTRG